MYPDCNTLSNVSRIKAWWKVAWQKAGKTLPVPASFFSVNEHTATTQTRSFKLKSNHFLKLSQKFPEEKQQLVEEKDADNIRKVLCKSFIQCFWELNLCCFKYRVDCFGSLRFFLLLLKWKSRNITKCYPRSPRSSQKKKIAATGGKRCR